MEHDIYSLQEAAKEAECEISDILKLGADGKINVCVFYSGTGYVTDDGEFKFYQWYNNLKCKNFELDDDDCENYHYDERYGFPVNGPTILYRFLLPLDASDLFNFWTGWIRDPQHKTTFTFNCSVVDINGTSIFYYLYDAVNKCRPKITIDEKSLFISIEGMQRLKAYRGDCEPKGTEATRIGQLKGEINRKEASVEAAVYAGKWASEQKRKVTKAELTKELKGKFEKLTKKDIDEHIWPHIPEEYRQGYGRPPKNP
jgi:hypothetical protein